MPLPTFVIIGERRCGTTSLYHWMSGHPDVCLFPHPDMNYFVEDEIDAIRTWREGEADPARWDATHTVGQYAELFRGGEKPKAVGHKGADLLYWTAAHERLARFVPDARFIVMLRNPVSRAWSHYWNEVGKGRETLGFQEALAAEERRAEQSAYGRLHLSYQARGDYARSLETLFKCISRRQILVLSLEECLRSPRDGLTRVYEFIGVDPRQGLEAAGKRRNENWTMVPRPWAQLPVLRTLDAAYSRMAEGAIVRLFKDSDRRRRARRIAQSIFRNPANRLRMSDDLRQQLASRYAARIDSVESLLERRFPEWRQETLTR